MTTWMVIGSSPGVFDAVAEVRAGRQDIRTVTTNRGIDVDTAPDVYFLSDQAACKMFSKQARQARKRGTTCATLKRDELALVARGIEWFDVFYREGHPWEPFTLSGLWCLEYAVRIGFADWVYLAGMDGYSPTGADYFGGGSNKNGDQTADLIQPITQKIVAKYPNVHFTIFGNPRYTIDSPNWEVVRC